MTHGDTSQIAGSVKATIVRNAVLRRITHGGLKPGDRIPSELDLARELRMNNRTVRRGLAQLVAEGVIIKQPGAGSFVRPLTEMHSTVSTALMLPDHMFHVQRFSASGLVFDGARRALDQDRFSIHMMSFTHGQLWENAGRSAVNRGVRGAIVMATARESPQVIQRLRDEGMHVVVLDAGGWHHIYGDADGWVGHDRASILYSLTHGLIERGFEQLIVYRFPSTLAWAVDEATIRSIYSLRGKHLDLKIAAFDAGMPTSDWSGFDLLPKAPVTNGARPIVIVPDETIALEVFRQCYARGLRVPQDVAIAAIMDHAPQLHPIPLTAVNGAKLINDMSKVAAESLARLLDGESPRVGGIILPTAIEWKTSTEIESK